MLKVILVLKFKDDKIKNVIFDEVSDLYIDYANNRLSLIDIPTGLEYKYHFRPIGNEKEQEATQILEIKIEEAE